MLKWFVKVTVRSILATVEVVLLRQWRNARCGRRRKGSESGRTTIREIGGNGVEVGLHGTSEQQTKCEKQQEKLTKEEG